MSDLKEFEAFLSDPATIELVQARSVVRIQKELAPQLTRIFIQEWMRVFVEEVDRRSFMKERTKE